MPAKLHDNIFETSRNNKNIGFSLACLHFNEYLTSKYNYIQGHQILPTHILIILNPNQ